MQIKLGKSNFFATIDADSYEKIKNYNWCLLTTKKGRQYAQASRNPKTFLMHRLIAEAPRGCIVDHVDGNGLNNKKNNLRLCTYSDNASNKTPKKGGSSRYLGVSWVSKKKSWVAQIFKNGKPFYLGGFKVEKDAALAYDRAAKEIHGDFARLNF
jgi:hypothetical protein